MKLALNSFKVNFLQCCWFWFWLRNFITRYLAFFVLKILSNGTPNYRDTKLTSIPVMDFIKMFMRNQVLHIVSGPKIKLAPTWIVYYVGLCGCYRFLFSLNKFYWNVNHFNLSCHPRWSFLFFYFFLSVMGWQRFSQAGWSLFVLWEGANVFSKGLMFSAWLIS